MSWGNKTVEKLRAEFVIAAKNTNNFSSLCREFGITRKTGYKWIARANNNESLSDRDHCAQNIPIKTSPETEALILSVRDDNPKWGGKTIHKVLENQGYDNLPCVKICNNILKRNGCIDPIESLKHNPCQRFERDNCNELWQTDFKGDFELLDGTRCYPLTILDDHSRFSIKIDPKINMQDVTESFKQAFLEYGMPWSILSDNGATFRGFKKGYTSFERWLMDHNILPIHGRIMHPQTQGKIERFHRSMKYELLKYNKFADINDANKGLQGWRFKYNNIRPHEALGMKCPVDIYVPSDRKYFDKAPAYEYSGIYPMIKVNSWGYLRFDKWQVYLSETMINTHLEIRPSLINDSFIACYRNFKIAEFDANTGERLNRNISRL